MPNHKSANAGLIHIYTGDGKGKTTAAVGLAVRCAGSSPDSAENRVVFCQFLKDNQSSELNILAALPQIELVQAPQSFGFYKNLNEEQRSAARQTYSQLLRRAISTALAPERPARLLVLDEAIAAYNHQLLERDVLLDFLQNKPDALEVVLTGREPAAELAALADYISNIQKVKHPFDQGIPARRGIEK